MSDRRAEIAGDEPIHRPVVGVVLCAAAMVPAGWAVWDFAPGDRPLPEIARRAMVDSLPRFKLTEPVNAVVYGFRGFDTFGETFLLLAAIVSVVLIVRRREPREGFVGEERAAEDEQPDGGSDESADEQEAQRAEQEEEGKEGDAPETPDAVPVGLRERERAHAMTVMTRTTIRAVLPFLTVAGAYLVAQGFSPGGGFPGGVVLLGVALLAYAGFGYPAISRVVRPDLVETVEMAGALAILAIFAWGVPATGSFGGSWMPLAPEQTLRSGGIVQAFSVTELVEVATGLVLAVFGLLLMEHDWASQDRAGQDRAGQDLAGQDRAGDTDEEASS